MKYYFIITCLDNLTSIIPDTSYQSICTNNHILYLIQLFNQHLPLSKEFENQKIIIELQNEYDIKVYTEKTFVEKYYKKLDLAVIIFASDNYDLPFNIKFIFDE